MVCKRVAPRELPEPSYALQIEEQVLVLVQKMAANWSEKLSQNGCKVEEIKMDRHGAEPTTCDLTKYVSEIMLRVSHHGDPWAFVHIPIIWFHGELWDAPNQDTEKELNQFFQNCIKDAEKWSRT